MKKALALALVLAAAACASPGTPPSTPAPPPGVPSPDPEPEADLTTSRPIVSMHHRTVGFLEEGVWISNELDGGRASDVWREGRGRFVVHLRPENAPINNSAWYAFKVWSREAREIELRLTYEDGRHRYWPEVRRQGEAWTSLDSAAVEVGEGRSDALLRLRVGPDTLWVAGQEMMTTRDLFRWVDSLAALPHVSRRDIATSPQGRPIPMVELGDPTASRHVMIIGRQHPPEVTGSIALLRFVEELAGDSPLATTFRRHFRIHVVPVVNPDGVDLGHWRHNTGGVDLNRDWVAFNQPETRAVRDAFLDVLRREGAELWLGLDFHSTQRDVFYTLDRSLETSPPDFPDAWLEYIGTHVPGYEVDDSPSGLATPTSRNWFYREFGAPALIYEVGDQTDRALIREVAAAGARGAMEILLGRAGLMGG